MLGACRSAVLSFDVVEGRTVLPPDLIRGQHERREGISAPPREPNAFLLPGRCVQSLRARGEDFAAVLGDPDAVLELGGERAVAGHGDRKSVVEGKSVEGRVTDG